MWCILAFIFSNLFSLLIAFMYGQLKGIANTKKWYEERKEKLTKAKDLLAKWVELYKPKLKDFPKPPIQVDTEQFLNSEVEK